MWGPALLSLLVASPALAFESTPQDLLFHDAYDVFSGIEYDTGYLPSGSPVGIRFYILSDGAAFSEMDAISRLSWPDALTHELLAVPDTGWFALDTDLEIAAQVWYDVFGYSGEIDVWSRDLVMYDEVSFDPLLLPSSTPNYVEVYSDDEGIDPFEYTIPVSVVDIMLSIGAWPRALASLAGNRIETGDSVMYAEGESVLLDVPAENPGWVDLTSVYYADMTADLDLVLEPAVQICVSVVITLCTDPIGFEIPITLTGVDEVRAFPPENYTHPLPAIGSEISGIDFGSVPVDTLANHHVEFTNIGRLDLEGWLSVEGEDAHAFEVYPEYVHGSEGNTDGVVLTYAPELLGEASATLVASTNDPLKPEIRIPITGEAVPLDGFCEEGPEQVGEVSACGCASESRGVGAVGWGLLGLAVLGLRRRRAR